MATRGVADGGIDPVAATRRFSYTPAMLRVFLVAAPIPDRADAWVRYTTDGRPLARGRDLPSRWPADAPVEAILAAEQVRIAALDLPPMPRNRVRQAVHYALEDQTATAADESMVAVTTSGAHVLAAIASARLIRAIAAHPRVERIIPESALAPCNDGWTWCRSAAGGGLVRRADGSAFAVGDLDRVALPQELRAALAQAGRASAAPAVVHVAFPAEPARLAEWSQSSGVPFAAAPAWDWERAASETYEAAPDFLARDMPSAAARVNAGGAQSFRPALILAALALSIHVAALLGQWSWLRVADWRLSRALVEQAATARLPSATPATAFAAIARRNAELRHRAGKNAASDAVPLLARAAPAIGELPKGVVKSATYVDAAWTIEFAKVDAEALSRVSRELRLAGVEAVSAPTAGGTRMRLTLDATAR